jgi:hypothetical protein
MMMLNYSLLLHNGTQIDKYQLFGKLYCLEFNVRTVGNSRILLVEEQLLFLAYVSPENEGKLL